MTIEFEKKVDNLGEMLYLLSQVMLFANDKTRLEISPMSSGIACKVYFPSNKSTYADLEVTQEGVEDSKLIDMLKKQYNVTENDKFVEIESRFDPAERKKINSELPRFVYLYDIIQYN